MPLYLSEFVPGPATARSPRGAPTAAGSMEGPYNQVRLGRSGYTLLWTDEPVRHPKARLLADHVDEKLAVTADHHLSRLMRRMVRHRPDVRGAIVSGISHLIRTNKEARRKEIWLGPGGVAKNLLWSQPARVFHSTKDIQDNFNRTAANLAGSTSSDSQFTWSEPQSTAFTTNGTTCGFSALGGTTFNVGLASLAMDTADHYTQIEVATFTPPTTGGLSPGVGVRITNGTGSSDSGYGFETGRNGFSNPVRRLYDWATDGTLASDTTSTTTGTLLIQASGSTITAKLNGTTIFSITDTTYPGTGSQRKAIISCYCFAATGSATLALDNFRAADLVAGKAPPLFHRSQRFFRKRRGA